MAIALLGGQIANTQGVNTGGSTGTTVTAAGSANTKGSWVEIEDSTAYRAAGLWLLVRSGAQSGDFLVDVSIGAAAAEQTIISNILVMRQALRWGIAPIWVPLEIPAGSRIAVRCQCSTANGSLGVEVSLVSGSPLMGAGMQVATTYGASTADSGGTGVDPGGVAHTKGSYSELTASTTAPIRWLIVCVSNRANTAGATSAWLLDIAIGAAASEQVIIPNLQMVADSSFDMPMPSIFAFPVDIPTGTRIAARTQSDTTDATDRLLDVVVIGVG